MYHVFQQWNNSIIDHIICYQFYNMHVFRDANVDILASCNLL